MGEAGKTTIRITSKQHTGDTTWGKGQRQQKTNGPADQSSGSAIESDSPAL